MKRVLKLVCCYLIVSVSVIGQETLNESSLNSGNKMLNSPEKLTIGGYGQIDFNQPVVPGNVSNGILDIHRVVLLFGYKISERTTFITEIELEHVKEVYVEQAYVNYEILPWLSLRGGLMLIPMGLTNEYHEPPVYNGVERPNLDKYIVPTTWREIGAGFAGQFAQVGFDYQLYIVNGFLGSNDGAAKMSGSSLFRSARQKGAESVISSPNVAFKINYSGVPGLTAGVSGYFGKSQSTLFDGIEREDPLAFLVADSSVVGMNMVGVDARYSTNGFGFKLQLVTGSVSNTDEYNQFHGSDLGSGFLGYYGEISYNLFHLMDFTEHELLPFFRYEKYDTHHKVGESVSANPAFNRTDLTFGIGWKPNSGLIYKADYQIFSDATSAVKGQFNAGIGVWF